MATIGAAGAFFIASAVVTAGATTFSAVQQKRATDDQIELEKAAHEARELARTNRALEVLGAQSAAAARGGVVSTSGSIVRIQAETDRRVRADQAFDTLNTEFQIGALRREGKTALIVGSLVALSSTLSAISAVTPLARAKPSQTGKPRPTDAAARVAARARPTRSSGRGIRRTSGIVLRDSAGGLL